MTAIGRRLRALPLPPRLARMVIEAQTFEAAEDAALLVERGLGGNDTDLDQRLARTAVTVQGHVAAENRVPLTFPEIADALDGCRPVLEAGGVFAPNMMDRMIALLRA